MIMKKRDEKTAKEQTLLPCSHSDKTALLEWSILPILLSFIIVAATI